MAERLVAADASPLIGLAAAGGFDLLRRLFGQLTITNTMRDEVLAGGDLPGAAELAAAIRDGWVQVEHTLAANAAFAVETGVDLGDVSGPARSNPVWVRVPDGVSVLLTTARGRRCFTDESSIDDLGWPE